MSWAGLAQQASWPVAALGALMLGVVALIKVWPQVKRVQADSDASLREDLLSRITKLEERTQELERMLAKEHARSADVEHDLANEMASLDAFIMLAEANPERVLEQIPRIRAMREAHRARMAVKRGAREGTVIAGATKDGAP